MKRFKETRYKRAPRGKSGKGASITRREVDLPSAEEEVSEEGLAPSERVVRIKRFPIKPMTVEEAIVQMELLDHSFFLFLNSASSEYNVLYCRQNGDYGIIEPELL